MRSSLTWFAGQGLDGVTIADHRYVVGDAAHLVELVRNQDGGDALPLELEQQVEQGLAVALRERRRRLVQNEKFDFLAQRLGDLDELLLASSDIGDERIGVLVEPDGLQQGAGARLIAVPVDDAVFGVLVAEEDVFGDRQHRHQGKLLVDDDDAAAFAVVDAAEVALLTLVDDSAIIGAVRINPRQHLHQGGFAGAVFPDNGVDLAFSNAQIDVRQGLHAWEGLGDVAHLKKGRGHRLSLLATVLVWIE